MSILEKIVTTENKVQTNIEKANKDALKLISDAREKSNKKAEEIRLETNDQVAKIQEQLLKKQSEIAERLKVEVNKQYEFVNDQASSRINDFVTKIFNEVIK